MKKLLVRAILLASLVLALPTGVAGGAVPTDGPWQLFVFGEVGTPANRCDPSVCDLGPNSEYAPDPPWTFTAPAEGSILIVVDAYNSGDVFAVYDFGTPIGSTSAAVTGSYCHDDPETCLLDPNMSSRIFGLAAGSHEITIIPTASPYGAGVAYFGVKSGWYVTCLPLVLRSAQP